jgi:hypothetical protein
MSDEKQGREGEFGDFAQALFVSLIQFDKLTGVGEERRDDVTFAMLYDYANDPSGELDEPTQAALRRNPQLARALDRLIAKTTTWHLPRAIAASSGLISRREAAGCVISFRESQADPRQIYVIIEIEESLRGGPRALFVRTSDSSYRKFALPEPDGGTIQILTTSDSDLVRILQDVDSEIFLR